MVLTVYEADTGKFCEKGSEDVVWIVNKGVEIVFGLIPRIAVKSDSPQTTRISIIYQFTLMLDFSKELIIWLKLTWSLRHCGDSEDQLFLCFHGTLSLSDPLHINLIFL